MSNDTQKQIVLFKVFMPESVMEPLREVLMSGYIGQGPKVDLFEKLLNERLKTEHSVTLNSATSALTLALKLAGVTTGDEVITTALTCTATNWPILAVGGIPVWADIDEHTANIDPKSIEERVTPKTKAIMVVHWGGYPCDMEEIWAIAKKHNLKVIEDCSHAFGSAYKGKAVGTQSDFGVYSFQAIKHMTTVDGGLLIVKDDALYKRAKLLRWYGIDRDTPRADFRCESDVVEWGYKFHMNDVNATIGIEQLKYVDNTLAAYKDNAAFYRKELQGVKDVELLQEKEGHESAYWIFTIKVKNRDQFITTMKERGIMTSRVHERNDKHTTVAAYKRDLPVLDRFITEMVCIPVGWWVTKEDRQYVVDAIKKGW